MKDKTLRLTTNKVNIYKDGGSIEFHTNKGDSEFLKSIFAS